MRYRIILASISIVAVGITYVGYRSFRADGSPSDPVRVVTRLASYDISEKIGEEVNRKAVSISAKTVDLFELLQAGIPTYMEQGLPNDRCGTALEISDIQVGKPIDGKIVIRGSANASVHQCFNTQSPVVSCKDQWIALPLGIKTKSVPRCETTFKNSETRTRVSSESIEFENIASLSKEGRYDIRPAKEGDSALQVLILKRLNSAMNLAQTHVLEHQGYLIRSELENMGFSTTLQTDLFLTLSRDNLSANYVFDAFHRFDSFDEFTKGAENAEVVKR